MSTQRIVEISAELTAALVEPVIPDVGLHRGIPAIRYHTWSGASQGRLKLMRDRSPAHVRWEMEHPPEPTPAQVLGAAVHTCVLEPDSFPSLYVRGIPGDGRTKAVQEARKALALNFPNAAVLSPDDFDTCLAIRDAVRRHPATCHMLEGDAECSAVWIDPETGVLCRGRFDDVALHIGAITDLKSTTDASPYRFRRTVYDYGYHFQGAHYLRGARTLGLDVDTFGIIAVEKEPPYAVAVYQLENAALRDGARELDVLLEQWAQCEASGVWPSYDTNVVRLDLPVWAPSQIDERLERKASA